MEGNLSCFIISGGIKENFCQVFLNMGVGQLAGICTISSNLIMVGILQAHDSIFRLIKSNHQVCVQVCVCGGVVTRGGAW